MPSILEGMGEPQIHSSAATLMAQCCDILHRATGMTEHEGLADLADYMVRYRGRHTLPDVVKPLLQAGVTPACLSQAVMQCQLCVLEVSLVDMAKTSAGEQVQALKQLIEHFHHIESNIVSVSEAWWQSRLDGVKQDLCAEREARIMAVAMQRWQRDKRIKLLNYYKGLPVQTVAEVVSLSEGGKLAVKLSPNLQRILAMTGEHSVLAMDDDEQTLIELKVYSLGDEVVHVEVQGLSDLKKRQHFRLEPLQPMVVQLRHHSQTLGEGLVVDFSLKHMDIRLDMAHPCHLQERDIVDLDFQLQGEVISGSAWVSEVSQDAGAVLLCVEFMPHARVQHAIQAEVARLQRKIIQDIKEKFTIVS